MYEIGDTIQHLSSCFCYIVVGFDRRWMILETKFKQKIKWPKDDDNFRIMERIKS